MLEVNEYMKKTRHILNIVELNIVEDMHRTYCSQVCTNQAMNQRQDCGINARKDTCLELQCL